MARKRTFGTRTELSAPMADLAAICRIDLIDSNASAYGFIFDEVLQLIKTPVANPIIHSPASVSLPDTFQVFHHYCMPAESSNNIFADTMVHMLHVTSFSSAELSKKPLSGTSAFRLKFVAQIFEFSFDMLDFRTVIEPAVRTDSQVIYSEVNAQNTVRAVVLLNGINLFRECEQEKTSTFLVNLEDAFIGFAPCEIFSITFRDFNRELLSGLKCPDYKHIAFDIGSPGKIIADRCLLDNRFCRFTTKSFLSFPTEIIKIGDYGFDGTTSLPYAADSNLGWQPESFSEFMIDSIMQFEVLSDIMFPSIINTELECFSISLHSSNYLLSGCDSDFCSCNSSHLSNGEYTELYKVSPPTTEVMGIRNTGFL